MNPARGVRRAAPLTAIVLAAGAGAWALHQGPAPATRRGEQIAPAAYHTFQGCQDLLTYLRGRAAPLVGPYGLADPSGVPVSGVPVAGVAVAGAAVSSAAADAGASRQIAAPVAAAEASGVTMSETGTNVQVAGVDEADVSKRSGDLVLTVSGKQQGLVVLRTSAGSAQVAGRLDLGWRPTQLLVDGHTALLLGSAQAPAPVPAPAPAPSVPAPDDTWSVAPRPDLADQRTRIAEVDFADAAHPRLVRTLDVDGSAVGARLAGGVLRLALSARPFRLPLVVPQLRGAVDRSSVAKAEAAALARNRAVVADSALEEWLPRYTLTPVGALATNGSLLGCDAIGVPDRFSGLSTLTLLTFDLRTQGVSRWKGAGVVAGGTTLYSTGDHTYVATTAWQPPVPVVPSGASAAGNGAGAAGAGVSGTIIAPEPAMPIAPPPATTQIHAFSTTADGVRYLGSGEVDGRLLDQYALDEYQGRLRVATTTGPAWGLERPLAAVPVPGAGIADAPGITSSVPVPSRARATTTSAVTVLQLRGGRLVRVGYVGGLGAGETIHGVRFAGPIGYVVTFRQTDPLYTLDLSDPVRPAVAGQLKLLGYSAYLHPLGNGLLLGVGQDASPDGARRGVLVSLFDAADPAHPRLLDRVTVPGSWAGTEADPHAFAYAGGLALVPLGTGMLAVRVEPDRLGTPSVLQLDRGGEMAGLDASSVRAFVDGGTVWTVAPGPGRAVLAAHDAASLAWLSEVSF